MVRRYCAANRLNRLGTLTYAGKGCHDPGELRADVGSFFKGLRGQLGPKPIPYLWAPEWHPGGHGLHVHFAVGRFIKQSLIREEVRSRASGSTIIPRQRMSAHRLYQVDGLCASPPRRARGGADHWRR